jgi:N-acetylmuramoyl-L-alanine amidase
MVTYTVRPNGTRGLIIELGLPRGAGGKLAGKLVIVDAGHGGTDSGARGVNGTYEKNNNLAMAQLLADNLRDAGANVIMTRATDVFIPLGERSHIANRAGADFFLSVHCDSTGGRSGATNGSTVYFHLNLASCKALAQSIAERLAAEVGTVRSKGIRSDGVIYPGAGFSVLRRSQMVSVLVETGYMTNPNDARYLNDPSTRKRIAGAIASGLRDFIEGNPYVDTRNINPQPESPWSTPPEGETPEAPMEGENAAPTNVSSIR